MDSNPPLCQTCGESFAPATALIFGKRMTQAHCDKCVAEWGARMDALGKPEKPLVDPWLALCPPLYQNTVLTRLPAVALAHLDRHDSARGLIFLGNSGTGKTRSMFVLMKRFCEEKKQVRFYTAADFRRANAKEAMAGRGDEFIEELGRADVLFIDDLGQMKVTDAAGEALLAVIEARTSRCLPCFFTSQYNGAELAAQFEFLPRGQAVVRRIREFCKAVTL